MLKRGLWISQFCLATFLYGCAAHIPSEIASLENKPHWIDNPGEGVSASAGVHARGRAAQEALAVSRAREEFAKRWGVTINSVTSTDQRVNNDRMSSNHNKSIHENLSQSDVKAVTKAKWLEPETQVLWIWLVPNP